MNLPPYLAYTAEDQNINGLTVRVITSLIDTTLTQDMMPAGKDLIVYGDNITINSALSLPGQTLTIIARTVTLGDGASIDLSGLDATNPWQNKATNGNPGASSSAPDATDGSKGATGAAGANGGQLVIVAETISGTMQFTSNGGAGAPGQGGGDGGTGLNGADGAAYEVDPNNIGNDPEHRHMWQILLHDGLPGATGGRAGAGGAGGKGGAGGNGGAVNVGYDVGPPPNITCTCEAGAGGAGGAGGQPGQGGKGGELGDLYTDHGGAMPPMINTGIRGKPPRTGKLARLRQQVLPARRELTVTPARPAPSL